MRNIIVCAVLGLLASCCPFKNYAHNDVPGILAAPTQLSFGDSDGLQWECVQEEVNDSLVWVSCDFENTTNYTSNVCIDVGYADKSNLLIIYNHRRICSGDVPPMKTSKNYAAFTKTNKNRTRITLNYICGPQLLGCELYTVKSK